MRTLRLLAVLAVGLSGTAACATGNPATAYRALPSSVTAIPSAPLAQPVQSPDGYSIAPPAGWVRSPASGPNGPSLAFFAPPADRPGSNPPADGLAVTVAPAAADLQTLVDQAKNTDPRIRANYRIVTDKPTIASGLPGHLLGGTYDVGGVTWENLRLIVVNSEKEYTVTFTGPASSFASLHAIALASMSTLTVS